MGYESRALRRFNYLLGETTAVYREVSVRLGLSHSVMQILYTVLEGGGARRPLQEVCVQTGISKQTINSALRKLEAEGYVRLEPAGGRNKDVCLTPEGEALAECTVAKIMAAENAVFAAWPEEDVEAYLALTERYLADFRAQAEGLRTP